jgi:polyisoprenoid-binding protein YceI
MMKRAYLILALVMAYGMTYSQVLFIDAEASEVEFEVDNFRLLEVDGTLSGLQGTLRFDTVEIENSNFIVCVDAATVNTGNEKRDDHLRSADFFDVEKYPKICFTSSSFGRTAEGYVVKGILSIRDVGKEVEIPFTFKDKVFEGEFEINRFDFGVGKEISTFKVRGRNRN